MTDAIEQRESKFDNNRLNRRVPSKYVREKEDNEDKHDEHYKKLFVFPNSNIEDNNKDIK